jgi:hypothetical protein
MKPYYVLHYISRAIVVLIASASGVNADNANLLQTHPYWLQGGAEVCVYELEQNRYRDLHKGHLVTVTVKEDFLVGKQVKNESYTESNSTAIVKRLELRRFPTGVYDYAVFSSVFTPLDRLKYPRSLKISSSVQEWCGTMFLQMNLREKGYLAQQRSYFEAEGDREIQLGRSLVEDELFNMIRMNPKWLPIGDFKMIPSAILLQTNHLPIKDYAAVSNIAVYKGMRFKGGNLQSYTVKIPSIKRVLEIVFEGKAPHRVAGWKDSYPSVSDGKIRTTRVSLKKTKVLEYWNLSRLSDQSLRAELGLPKY